jgi:dTDP-4-dehydrorhamnose 3,5-epimerase-like enzyme
MSNIERVKVMHLQQYVEENGGLVVIDAKRDLSFTIARVFMVHAGPNMVRGEHAHFLCSQLLVASSGTVEVTCDDGVTKNFFELSSPAQGLLVPPGIWAVQNYIEKGSGLIVFCDRPYEPEDYIRDYDQFLQFKLRI